MFKLHDFEHDDIYYYSFILVHKATDLPDILQAVADIGGEVLELIDASAYPTPDRRRTRWKHRKSGFMEETNSPKQSVEVAQDSTK